MNLLQQRMQDELQNKSLFEQAKTNAYSYMNGIRKMDTFPSKPNLENMAYFEEPLPKQTCNAIELIEKLHEFGSPATIAQTGGRYFGFINGGAIPVSLGVKWLTDVWDQCGGLYLTSPINSKLESICEDWLKSIFNLPPATVAGFVSGTSMANLCGLAAARFHLLQKMGWDINEKGLGGAPAIRIIAHEQAHASIKKTLALLGYGKKNIEWVASDDQGRCMLEKLPPLDASCLVLLQAGNANTGSFDNFDAICDLANKVGAWVHIDGAFGLWAAASTSLSYLTKGMQKASSWAVDGHKTLNTPYDSGVILCKYPKALISALQATGEYILYSEQRDPLLYTPELSKRARAIELWATMKYLGSDGIDTMITTFHERAKQLEYGLTKLGLEIVNEVVFNQVLVATKKEKNTKELINYIQNSRECWLGGSTWNGKTVIRISICSWMTTEKDIEHTLLLFEKGMEHVIT